MPLPLLVFAIGLLSGFLGGMTGIGGALLAVPLLLNAPAWLGLYPLSVHAVTGLAMVQGLTTNLVGMLVHQRAGFFSSFLFQWVGSGMVVGSLLGAVGSRWLPAKLLLLLLGCVLLISAMQMLRPLPTEATEKPFVPRLPLRFMAAGFLAGLLSGATGLGAAVLVLVLLIRGLKVPVRLAIGSTMGTALLAALTGTLGKSVTQQVPLVEAIALSFGAAAGAVTGAKVSHRLSLPILSRLLALLVVAASVHAFWKAWMSQ